MIEIKIDGKEPRKALAIVGDGRGNSQSIVRGNLIDILSLLTQLVQNISDSTKIPVHVITEILNKAPNLNTGTMTIDLDQIKKMFGKE